MTANFASDRKFWGNFGVLRANPGLGQPARSDSVCEHRDSRAGGGWCATDSQKKVTIRVGQPGSTRQAWRQASEHCVASIAADNVRIHARTFRICAPFSSAQLLALVVCAAPTADTGSSSSNAPRAPTQVANADGAWGSADGSDAPVDWHETCVDQNRRIFA